MAKSTAQKVQAPATPVPATPAPVHTLVSVTAPKTTLRAGTARAACFAYLQANLGKPRAEILAGLKATETAWHLETSRVVKGVNPSGWLVLFSATFTK